MSDKKTYEEEKKKYHKEASLKLKEASKDSIDSKYLLDTAQYHEMASGDENAKTSC
jgi:thiamine pyrophosphokinase